MSREIDLGWESHIYENQEELRERITNEWHFINNTYYVGKYDINKTLTKDELQSFLWTAYNHCMRAHYDDAGVTPGARLFNEHKLTVTKYRVSYAGQCRRWGPASKNAEYTISISYRYYEDWGNVQILEVLYHEIGHLSYWDHDEEFWAEGERIGYGLEPEGIKARAAKFVRYCEVCGHEYHSVSRPSKYYVCPICWPYGDDAPEPNFNTWLKQPSEDKKFMIVKKYSGPEILLD